MWPTLQHHGWTSELLQHTLLFPARFTYLDVTGRPVIVLRKSHLVPEHAATFDVDYSFATISLLREPLLLITGVTSRRLARRLNV